MDISEISPQYQRKCTPPNMSISYMETFKGIQMYRHKLGFSKNNYKIIHGVINGFHHYLISFEQNGILLIGLVFHRDQADPYDLPKYKFSTINYFIPKNNIHNCTIISSNYFRKISSIKAYKAFIYISLHRFCRSMYYNHHLFNNLTTIFQQYTQ